MEHPTTRCAQGRLFLGHIGDQAGTKALLDRCRGARVAHAHNIAFALERSTDRLLRGHQQVVEHKRPSSPERRLRARRRAPPEGCRSWSRPRRRQRLRAHQRHRRGRQARQTDAARPAAMPPSSPSSSTTCRCAGSIYAVHAWRGWRRDLIHQRLFELDRRSTRRGAASAVTLAKPTTQVKSYVLTAFSTAPAAAAR